MKRIIAISIVALLALAGCGSSGAKDDVYVVNVDVNGTQVPCVVYDGYKAGGITCDWEAN